MPGIPKSVAGRVLLILKAFQTRPEWSLSELSETAGLPLSTTHRLLSEMHDGGLLSRSADRRFRIGPLVTALAVTGAGPRPSARVRRYAVTTLR